MFVEDAGFIRKFRGVFEVDDRVKQIAVRNSFQALYVNMSKSVML